MSRSRSVVLALLCGLLLAVGSAAAPAALATTAAPKDPCVSVGHPFDNDGRISGTELIPVTVQDVSDQPPAKAELFVDGELVGTDETEWPVSEGGCGIVYIFEVSWDTTVWSNGTHELRGRATLADGSQHWSSNTLPLVVEN